MSMTPPSTQANHLPLTDNPGTIRRFEATVSIRKHPVGILSRLRGFLLGIGCLAALQPVFAEPVDVLCFGDSITEGNMLADAEKSMRWTNLVEQKSAGKFHLINSGKGGRPTGSVPEFQTAWKKASRGDAAILILALGTNDSRDLSPACVPSATTHLREMILLARSSAPGLRILLIGPPNLNKEALGPTRPIADQRIQKLQDLNAAYKSLAGETGCEFLPLFGRLPAETMSRDGVHPDAAGNEVIANEVLGVLLNPPPG